MTKQGNTLVVAIAAIQSTIAAIESAVIDLEDGRTPEAVDGLTAAMRAAKYAADELVPTSMTVTD